jgi:hypothetical protein
LIASSVITIEVPNVLGGFTLMLLLGIVGGAHSVYENSVIKAGVAVDGGKQFHFFHGQNCLHHCGFD